MGGKEENNFGNGASGPFLIPLSSKKLMPGKSK